MIRVMNKEHFKKVWDAAKQMGLRDSIKGNIQYLNKYGCKEDPKRTRCLLQYDWAPLSFGFLMTIRNDETGEYDPWFNGGLIWHENAKRWQVHT